jgi:hypothetical protein
MTRGRSTAADPRPDPNWPFTTREAALCVLFEIIRRNGGVELHHLRILCELAELPARTRAAIA